MKLPAIALCAAAVLILTQSGCERHSASETVPGHAEKLAEQKAEQKIQASTPETVNPESPRFFPPAQ